MPCKDEVLGTWVRTQRTALKKDTLSDEQKEMLNSAGFVLTVHIALGYDMQWKSMFDALKQYKNEHNHCKVPCKDEVLGSCVRTQRAAFKKATLSDE